MKEILNIPEMDDLSLVEKFKRFTIFYHRKINITISRIEIIYETVGSFFQFGLG